MGIRQVASGINLMRFYFYQQVDNQLDVVFSQRLLFHGSRFIEGHVEKMHLFIRYSNVPATCFCFTSPYQPFNTQNLLTVYLTGTFALQRLNDGLVKLFSVGLAESELLVEVADKICETDGVIVEHGNVARGLIRHVHLMSLVDEADKCSAH